MAYYHEKSRSIVVPMVEKLKDTGITNRQIKTQINRLCPFEMTDHLGVAAWNEVLRTEISKLEARRKKYGLKKDDQGKLF